MFRTPSVSVIIHEYHMFTLLLDNPLQLLLYCFYTLMYVIVSIYMICVVNTSMDVHCNNLMKEKNCTAHVCPLSDLLEPGYHILPPCMLHINMLRLAYTSLYIGVQSLTKIIGMSSIWIGVVE